MNGCSERNKQTGQSTHYYHHYYYYYVHIRCIEYFLQIHFYINTYFFLFVSKKTKTTSRMKSETAPGSAGVWPLSEKQLMFLQESWLLSIVSFFYRRYITTDCILLTLNWIMCVCPEHTFSSQGATYIWTLCQDHLVSQGTF